MMKSAQLKIQPVETMAMKQAASAHFGTSDQAARDALLAYYYNPANSHITQFDTYKNEMRTFISDR